MNSSAIEQKSINQGPRMLVYRGFDKLLSVKFGKFLLVILFLFFSYELSSHLREIYHYGLYHGGHLCWQDLVMNFLFFVFIFFVFTFYRGVKVQAYPQKLVIYFEKNTQEVMYEEIEKIDVGYFFFNLQLKNGEKVRISNFIERLDYILEAIYQFNPQLMDGEEYQSLRKKVILNDHQRARINERIYLTFLIYLIFFFLTVLFLMALYWKQSGEYVVYSPADYFQSFFKEFFQLVFVSLFLQFYGGSIKKMEKISLQNLEHDSANKKRDMKKEKLLFTKSILAIWSLSAILFGTIYYYNLNMFWFSRVSSEAKHLGVKSSFIWLDKRFNCTHCKYQLKLNDKIMTTDRILGKIVQVSGAKTFVNKKNKQGRYLASTVETVIPKGYVAILIGQGNVIRLVKEAEIRAKIHESFQDLAIVK